ncbi:MAG: LemA family protein [Alistipes sp.]|jgi:LemA protein|nr:LemA family protein [Alistipes sp.]MBO7264831.1 LemA family protein [Alistipes sp.]
MKNKGLWIFLGILAVVVVWAISGYNGLVSNDENVNQSWANVESAYQRRSDLIPNLVNTVKGYAEHEQKTLQDVVEARSKATSISIDASTATPEQMQEWMAAQQEVGSALGRLIAVSESYPTLRANENFLELQAQLEGTENRIKVERDRYNEAVKSYNVKIRRFPTNILAGLFGFDKRTMFEAQEGAERAPEVQF